MFNIVVLTGRLTADAELKTTPNGIPVTAFSIAVNRNYRAGEEQQTDFINIVAWRQRAEFITKYFKKGDMIGIEGSIQTRKYQDKNGNNRTAFEVVVNNAQFVESKRNGNNVNIEGEEQPQYNNNTADDFTEIGGADDDDLPF